IMLGLSRREARARFDEMIAFAELEEFLDLKLKNYSSGMHVRLAFSIAVQVDADVLLVDEVLAVGDAAFQQKCFDKFLELRREGRTIVLVTHDMGAVQRFCDQALLLERGRMLAIGESGSIVRKYMEVNFGRTVHVGAPGGSRRARWLACASSSPTGSRPAATRSRRRSLARAAAPTYWTCARTSSSSWSTGPG